MTEHAPQATCADCGTTERPLDSDQLCQPCYVRQRWQTMIAFEVQCSIIEQIAPPGDDRRN